MLWECKEGCQVDQPKSAGHPGECEKHGRTYAYTKGLRSNKQLVRVSQKKQPEVRRRGSTLKRGRGFAVSPAQREKVRGLPCVCCGHEADEYLSIDPAHLWPRGRGGCDDPLCVVPLCRRPGNATGCHTPFDEGKLDILPALIDRGYYAELGHAIGAHQLSPLTLLERTTGTRWQPVPEAVAHA